MLYNTYIQTGYIHMHKWMIRNIRNPRERTQNSEYEKLIEKWVVLEDAVFVADRDGICDGDRGVGIDL